MTADENPGTKEAYYQKFHDNWNELESFLATLSDDQMLTPSDAAGWNVRDHVAHLEAWERTRIALLRKQSMWGDMDVSKEEYLNTDFDPLNEKLRQRTIDQSPAEAMAKLRATNQQLLADVHAIPEEELVQPVRDFHPDLAETRESVTVFMALDGDAGAHFAEHLPWIQAIVRSE